MARKIIFFLMWTFIPAVCFAQADGGGLSGNEIAKKTIAAYYYVQKDGSAKVHMRNVNKSGMERIRDFTMLRLNMEDNGEQFYFCYFQSPPDVKRTAFLVAKHITRDDDRWLYLPAVDLVKRISTNDKRSSFLGAEFTYEDVAGRHLEEDNFVLIREEFLDNRRVYVLKGTPKDASAMEFSYRMSWVDKESFLPLKIEFYNKAGKPYKVAEAKKIETIQNAPTITDISMRNLETGNYSTMTFSNVAYNIGLTPDIFQERSLRKPTGKWIKDE